MKMLVTGSTGFLGKTLCPLLEAQGCEVVGISTKSCDLAKRRSLDLFETQKFDRIYHLAVWTQSGDFCVKHPAEQWVINQQINTHLLDWWQRFQPQAKLIAIGTSCAYDPTYPLEERYYLSGRPIESMEAFGMTKRMLLTGLKSLNQQYGLNYLFPIPATLYGPSGFHEDGKQMHFIFDLVRKIVRGKLYGEKVVLWGDGTQRRELLHVEDFARAVLELSETRQNEEINIGEGKDHSIREFAEMICEHAEYPFSKIEFDTSRYVGAKAKLVSTAKLQEALPGFSPRSLKDGLGEMVRAFSC